MVDCRDRLVLWADVGLDVAKDAIDEIDRLHAEVERLEGALRNSIPAVPDDGYLPGLNSLMCDAPLRSPEEQFTRRMLREAIARCLFTGLPDEREWMWGGTELTCEGHRFTADGNVGAVYLARRWATNGLQKEAKAIIPTPIWDRAWRECGMEDR